MPEHRHVHLAEQVDRPRRVDQRQVLRRRDDHRAVRPRLLDQRQLHVAGAGRQVDDQHLGIAPVGLDQPGERARRHRPAPGERMARRDQLAERQELQPLRLDRDQPVVLGRRLRVAAEQGRLRRAVDVGVDQPDLLARSRQRDGEVGGDAWTCRRRPCRCRRRSASGAAATRSSRCALRSTPSIAEAAS